MRSITDQSPTMKTFDGRSIPVVPEREGYPYDAKAVEFHSTWTERSVFALRIGNDGWIRFLAKSTDHETSPGVPAVIIDQTLLDAKVLEIGLMLVMAARRSLSRNGKTAGFMPINDYRKG